MRETASPNELSKEGNAAYKRGDFTAAATAFKAASQGYKAAGENQNAAEMANNSSVAYLQAGDAVAALDIVQGTQEIFAEIGDLKRQGMAFGNEAAALEALKRLDEAAEAYQQSADLLAQAGEDKLRANVMQSLSTMQFRSGRQIEALSTMQDGLEGVKRPSPHQRFLKRLIRIPFDMMNRNKT
jgi:tetratricopeptide (TPR) repeat protein